MKSMAEYALENKALIKLFIAFLVIGGLWSFYSMSKMEDPEITVKQALVMTVYPGVIETQPSLQEALLETNLAEQMGADYWVSFTCGDDTHTWEGDDIRDCAKALSENHNTLLSMGKDKRKVSFVGKYPAETITMVYPSEL